MTTATLVGGFSYFEGLSISPNTGPESGSTEITILGAGFDETTTALIGNVPVENLTLVDSATLTGTTGVSTYGVYDVVTTTGTVVTQITNGFTYTVDDVFALTSVSPNYGSAVGGNTVTFTGTCFDANTTFTIGGESVTDIVIVDSTTATGTAPAGAAGWVNVAAQQGMTESTLTEAYQYIAIFIASVSPTADYVAGGSAIQITGIGFEPDATITIGGAALIDPVIVSDTVITGTIPAGSVGPANVIATKGASSYTVTDQFEYLTAFTATDISPSDGYVVGGDAVTITGTGFSDYATVSIGGNLCTDIIVVNTTTITAITPSGTAGSADVVVSQFGGTATINDGFTYAINPTDIKGDKPINETYNNLMFLTAVEGSPSKKRILDADGKPTPIEIDEAEVKIFGNLCASGACVGYLEPDGSIFELGTNSLYPVGYRNISLALMLNQTLTPFHFGAKGIGLSGVEDDTTAFQNAINWCKSRHYKLHIPNPGSLNNVRYYVFNKTLVIDGPFEITSDRNALMVWQNVSSFETSIDSPASPDDMKCGIQIGSYMSSEYPNNPSVPYSCSFNFPALKYNPLIKAGETNPQSCGELKNTNVAGIKLVNVYLVDITLGYCWNWDAVVMTTATRGGSPNYDPNDWNNGATYCANNIIQFNTVDLGSALMYVNCTAGNCILGDTYMWGSTSGVSVGGKTLKVISNINDGGVCYGMQLTIPGIYGKTTTNTTPVLISDKNVGNLPNIASFKTILKKQQNSNKLTYNHFM